jgi:hypothetical protein
MKISPWCCVLLVAALAGCQTPVSPGTPIPAPPAAAAHPADAVAFQGHWYRAYEEAGSWHQAKARCESMGGYLVCIESADEQNFIAILADGRYLSLGATDEKEEDVWVWVNGAPFNPTFWMSGQPNNYGGDENYLATYDGGEWVDVAAEGGGFWMPTGFICEWDH